MDLPVTRNTARGVINSIRLADEGVPLPLADLDEALLLAEEDFDETNTVDSHPHQPYIIAKDGAVRLEYLTRTPAERPLTGAKVDSGNGMSFTAEGSTLLTGPVTGAKPVIAHQFTGQRTYTLPEEPRLTFIGEPPVPTVQSADKITEDFAEALAKRYGIEPQNIIRPCPRMNGKNTLTMEMNNVSEEAMRLLTGQPRDTDEEDLREANRLRDRFGKSVRQVQEDNLKAVKLEAAVTPTAIARRSKDDPRMTPAIVVGSTVGTRAPTRAELKNLAAHHGLNHPGKTVDQMETHELVSRLLAYFEWDASTTSLYSREERELQRANSLRANYTGGPDDRQRRTAEADLIESGLVAERLALRGPTGYYTENTPPSRLRILIGTTLGFRAPNRTELIAAARRAGLISDTLVPGLRTDQELENLIIGHMNHTGKDAL